MVSGLGGQPDVCCGINSPGTLYGIVFSLSDHHLVPLFPEDYNYVLNKIKVYVLLNTKL